MEKLIRFKHNRKPLSFRAGQTLYGVSILLTFLLTARLSPLA